MEVITFDGKEYVKASVLAARFRYTADYLGQLCRGKKVDARLVGRAWYINVESLNTHKDTRYKPLPKDETATTIQVNKTPAGPHYATRIDVEPILKKKTVSIYQAKPGGLTEVKVKYESDEHALIPRVYREAVSKEIKVDPAEAEMLQVKGGGKNIFNFKAEELPVVYLRGSLRVKGLEEATEAAEPRREDDVDDTELATVEETEAPIVADISPEIKSEREEPVIARSIKVRTKRLRSVARTDVAVPTEGVTALLTPQAMKVTVLPEKPLQMKPVTVTAVPNVTPEPPLIRPRLIRAVVRSEQRARIVDIQPKKKAEINAQLAVLAPLPPLTNALTPQSVTASTTLPSFKPQVVKEKESIKADKIKQSSGWLLPVAISCFALLIASSMFIVEVDLEVSKQKNVKHIFFTTDQLEAAVSLID